MSQINFAVPSESALDEHEPIGIMFEKAIEPGIINRNIELFSKSGKETSHVVMFDGKKILPNSADVYLLNEEEEPKLSALDSMKSTIHHCLQKLVDDLYSAQDNVASSFKELVHVRDSLCYIIKQLGEILMMVGKSKAKKKIAVERVEQQLMKTQDSKFKFALNRIRTSIHELNVSSRDLLDSIDSFAFMCTSIHGSHIDYLYQVSHCDVQRLANYFELGSPLEVKESLGVDEIPPCFTKQRSKEWFDIRNTVKVTGSTAHSAIGLNTLKECKEFFGIVIGGNQKQTPNAKQKEAMEYGCKNEINGIATVVAKLLPVFYPSYQLYEEGSYIISDEKGQPIIVSSPDGSIKSRNEQKIISLEIKCPFSDYAGATPVYYDVQFRHIVQSLLEMEALNSTEHLYICWSENSTTVFRMYPDKDLTERIVQQVHQIFYSDVLKCPTRISDITKGLKQDILKYKTTVEYLGEFPSLKVLQQEDPIQNYIMYPSSPYRCFEKTNLSSNELKISDCIEVALKTMKSVEIVFDLLKPVASEVLVYLMSDLDRNWSRESGHGIPIAYLIKGCSLTSQTARRILEKVLDEIFSKHVHVPCVTFDGQFHQLKDFDKDGNPSSLFALQRQVWSETKHLSKRNMLDELKVMYSDCKKYVIEDLKLDANGIFEKSNKRILVEHTDPLLPPIKTATWLLKTNTKNLNRNFNISSEKDSDTINSLGILDESTIRTLQEVLDGSSAEEESVSEFSNKKVQPTDENVSFHLQAHDYEMAHTLLKSGKRAQKWNSVNLDEIRSIFSSVQHLNNELNVTELTEIIKYLNIRIKAKGMDTIKQSLRKSERINRIAEILGLPDTLTEEPLKRKECQPKPLYEQCFKIVNSKSYPKQAIAVSYCQSIWPSRKKTFYDKSSSQEFIQIIDLELGHVLNFNPLYLPVYSSSRGQSEVKIMDGTHIRTNIKSKLIRSNLNTIRLRPWQRVAISGQTNLTLPMLQVQETGKIMHQQSDAYVRTMFSEKVQEQLSENGDFQEAQFCKLFREWHEAEDRPGLSALERCSRSLSFRQWLLEDYNFSFPPPSMYIKGIPRVTFEGLICSIDAHLFLYSLVKSGTYNWRAVSTLVAENFMGELAEGALNNHGVPSGQMLKYDMAKISHIHCMRMNPERGFQLQTSRARTYDIQRTSKISTPSSSPCHWSSPTKIVQIYIRDHPFDQRPPKKAKEGKMSSLHEVPKGVKPIRHFYKVDETNILPSLRLGLQDFDLDV